MGLSRKRFECCHSALDGGKKSEGILAVGELIAAKLAIWKRCQQVSFHDAYEKISKGQLLSASDQLNKLSPFLDKNGLLRLQVRLQHSKSSYEIKHPTLFSAKRYVVIKLIEDAHRANFHEGTEDVRCVLRQEYWVIGLRNALRSVKAKCVKCRKQRAGVSQIFMADLPQERLQERVSPFSNTGIDYFGPFEVKFMRKTMRRCCCLFTCLTTRAVHIEVVPSLEAETCLTAITRFIARRGKPATILSDNRTNFVGAAKEMRDCINAWNLSDIEMSLAQKDIKWNFNPPGAPHFGGIWERLVRSCREAMIAVLDGRSLTDDVLITTMCLVEQTLNARPLTSVSVDPDDLEALTPNHFLLERANLPTPFLPDAQRYTDLRPVFRVSQAYSYMIWTRWTKEYLPEGNVRNRWNKDDVRQLKVNDLVWVLDENVKRSNYKMARVLEVQEGSDSRVRSATVVTKDGKLKRPIVKQAPMFYESVFSGEKLGRQCWRQSSAGKKSRFETWWLRNKT